MSFVVVAAQLAVDPAQVAARQVLLLAPTPALEHHLVKNLVIFLGGGSLSQVHRVRSQWVVKVGYPLRIPDALRLAAPFHRVIVP